MSRKTLLNALLSWVSGRRPRLTTRRLEPLQLEDRTLPSGVNWYPPNFFFIEDSIPTAGRITSTASPLDIAIQYFQSHADAFNLTPSDLVNPIITSQYTDADSGNTYIYLRQSLHGLAVANADLNIAIGSDGRVISAGGGFVPGLNSVLAPESVQPIHSPTQAVQWAMQFSLEGVKSISEVPQAFIATNDLEHSTIIASSISPENITAKLQYVPTPDGRAVLAWNLNLQTPGGDHWYDLHIADTNGSLVALSDWVDNDAYKGLPTSTGTPVDGGFFVQSNPADTALASPYGWHDTNGSPGAEFTDTRGNNVDAHLDRDANNTPDTPRPSGGTSLEFTGPTHDPTQQPTVAQNQELAVIQLFYYTNLLHDIHYKYGFTEAAGNFQTNNYGRGGSANDPLNADAQDGSGTNNANFATPVDGLQPRMQMYLYTFTNPQRDGDFDIGTVGHEFTHGISNRLTGGPANANALNNLQSGGMGEGWSDFVGHLLMQRATDLPTVGYGHSTYTRGEDRLGAGNRSTRYSYDFAIDAHTFNDFNTVSTQVHYAGEIWCSALWDLSWLLRAKYGFDADWMTGYSAAQGPGRAGNKLALKLVMDAMKLQPSNPSFVQARDAIVAADNALTGGANAREIWTAFARRGLGQNASTASSTSTTVTIDFTIPPSALGMAISNITATTPLPAVTPAPLSVVTTAPTSFTLNLSDPISPASIQLSLFTVNGIVPTDFTYTPGSTTITFNYAATPVTTQGQQVIQLAAGAFTRLSDASPVGTYSSSFRYDVLPMQVTSTSPASGTTFAPPLATIDINLNEPVAPASVSTLDLQLTDGSVTGYSLLNGNQTIRYTLSGLTSEKSVTATILAGKLTDTNGNPNTTFTGTYQIDYTTDPAPALAPINPIGSRIAESTVVGLMHITSDVDEFTLSLEAGQSLAVVLSPASTLRPKVTIFTPPLTTLATTTGTVDGVPITAQGIAPTTGTYTVRVEAVNNTTGNYLLDFLRNAAQETESLVGSSNNTSATAQALTLQTESTALGTAKRTAVLGTTDPATAYSASPVPYAFEDISATGNTVLEFADDASTSIAIPFSFTFYGTNYSTVFFSDNGLITFGSGSTINSNTNMSSSPSQAAIAVLWDDLELGSDGIKWQVLGSAGNRRVVIQWQNCRYWTMNGSGTFNLQFQAVLFEGTNEIRFNYSNLSGGVSGNDGGISSSIGIKAAGSAGTLLLSQNNSSIYHGNGKSTIISPPGAAKDYYSFSATAGDSVTLALSALSAGTPTLELFGTNGTTLLGTGVTGATNYTTGISNISIPETGTYFAAVGAGVAINYSLSAFLGRFDTEPNNTSATAQNLISSTFGAMTAGDTDWYSFTMPANTSTLKLETSTPGGLANGLDPKIDLFANNGTTLLGSGVALGDARNETLTVNGLTAGSTYRVRLTTSGGTTGDYFLNAFASSAIPVVSDVAINSGALQRSRVTAIDVTFSTEVTLAPGAISLTRGVTTLTSSPGGGILVNTSLVGNQTVAALIFDSAVAGVEAGSLSDGIWTLTVTASGVTGAGGIMPADFVQNNIKRLFGDSNGDGTVDGAVDFPAFGSFFNETTPNSPFDSNGDNIVDGAIDFPEFGARFNLTL